ncbi:MAG: hypothetical protein IKE95_09730 [Methanobrevibacter sp.]|nr:hypothetical protein [Methanobrevibacter sp.]
MKKFATEAEYTAATLNYPAVSWVTATDNVHFDKSGSTPTVNDKVMIASYDGSGESKFIFYNCEASTSSDITSITFDDVAVEPITCQTESDYDAEQVHIAKYTFNGTTIGDWCAGDLGCSQASTKANIDVLIPSQITTINNIPGNVLNIVVEATTPPYIEALSSVFGAGDGIYVPDALVNTYKVASGWYYCSDKIFPISEYSGNLPV